MSISTSTEFINTKKQNRWIRGTICVEMVNVFDPHQPSDLTLQPPIFENCIIYLKWWLTESAWMDGLWSLVVTKLCLLAAGRNKSSHYYLPRNESLCHFNKDRWGYSTVKSKKPYWLMDGVWNWSSLRGLCYALSELPLPKMNVLC